MIKLVLEQPSLGESGQILVRSKLRAVMQRMGFRDVRREAAELVCTEILTNQYKYAGGGGVFQIWETLQPLSAIELFAVDFGPGIPNLVQAREDGFTTSGSMGRGLGAIERLADESAVYSLVRQETGLPWSGVAAWARFVLRDSGAPVVETGGFVRAYHDARENGDCVCMALTSDRLCWLHLDGLGHGAEAASVVQGMGHHLDAGLNPRAVMENVSARLRGGRGAVGVAADLALNTGTVRVCGVGDMSAAILDAEKRNLPFSPGILGHAHRRFQTTEIQLERGTVVLTASDGLRRSWNEQSFPGLWHHHPQMVALLLGNVVGRNNDDKSVFAVRLNKEKG